MSTATSPNAGPDLSDGGGRGWPLQFARGAFGLLILSLGFPQLGFGSFRWLGLDYGQPIPLTDALFLISGAAFGLALLARQARLRWHPFFWLLLAYAAAAAFSALLSEDVGASAAKLAGTIYLVALPALAFQLIDDADDLDRAIKLWLAATAVVGLLGAATLLLFWSEASRPLVQPMIYYFGTLPAGDYPRLKLSFHNANMLCTYLTVGLMLLLASIWVGRVPAAGGYALAALLLVAATFTISPGLGGIALALGIWLALQFRADRPALARLFLLGGLGAAALFIPALVIAPDLHPTAPFLWHLPGIGTVAPSGRVMTWVASWETFSADPLSGRGLGLDPCRVWFKAMTAPVGLLRDAHNIFLSVAAQMGLPGLAALLAILVWIARSTGPIRLPPAGVGADRVALGIALLSALAYQGLGGSFEDARHLWAALGLFLVAVAQSRLPGGEARSGSTQPSRAATENSRSRE